jgi:hypothetical protein
MTSADTIITRHLLRAVHSDVKKAFPQIRNVVEAASVTGNSRFGYHVQIDVDGLPQFHFDCRGYNSADARFEAWHAFLHKHTPEVEN